MKAHRLALCAVTAFAWCAGIEASYAQTWRGPYLAGTIGSGMQPDGDNRIVRFDKTLDGDFGDTITTVAGANAFSPGFCNGAAVSATPGGGCRRDDRAPDFAARGGYDWQMGSFVAGAVGEFSRMEQTSSVSAFSTTPAFYTLTRELNWLNGFRGRAGYGSDHYLVYGTGGIAMARIEHSFATSNMVNTFNVPSGNQNVWDIRRAPGWSSGWPAAGRSAPNI